MSILKRIIISLFHKVYGHIYCKIRLCKYSDLVHIERILEYWVINLKTGKSNYDEIKEDMAYIKASLESENERKYYVAEKRNGHIIGLLGMKPLSEHLISYTTTNSCIELVNIYVRKDSIRRGVGTRLINYVEERIKEKLVKEIIISSSERFRYTAWPFYVLKGYLIIGNYMNKKNNLFCEVFRKTLNE